ncbi:hypothetical protein B9Z55_016760 [Caenorhabditis nigoni]|uniref:G-protein coupled receptors family 1 profile domain-containing protein n=1 Tax=Caenorhabditis nigoni TaxID=1611254 RepID=A0A2G5T641_9PELO|nr:hypothetical protein B9Z55_016760 [Caenorhabditis nigoni]
MEEYRKGYYAENCHPEKFTWFDGWEYPAYVSHSISLILIPLNIFGGYCILFQTPKKMEASKWVMINVHFWSSFLDLLIVPCPTPVYFEPNVFVLMDHQGRWFIQLQCTTFFCVLILQGAFFVSRTVYFLTAYNSKISEKTRELQKKFFKSVCIQVAIPVFVVILPILYCGCAIEWYWYYQSFSNTAIICITFHGMSSTIAILSIYEPYRTYTKSCIAKIFKRKSSSPTTPKNVSVTSKTISRRTTSFNIQV